MKRKPFNWREFLILWAAGVVGVIAVLPYTLTLQAPMLETMPPLPMPLAMLIAIQVGQNAVLVAIAVGLGLLLARRVGLGAPLLEARLDGQAVGQRLRAILTPSILAGAAAAVVIILLDLVAFARGMPPVAPAVVTPPAWQGLLASFYGGITEELFMRLFLMSLLAWLLGLVWRKAPGQPAAGAFWTANLGAAILFGLGHLPATAALVPLTALVVARAVVLNGIGGLVFGHLYWKRGLEAAMLAHFSADIVLHVLTPLVLGLGGMK
ncbi:MAG: CPBP family intramembrane metalloprotease [Chloroflexi bacterium]|nr:CPBP family intramembrane metalloprotease [Chloroflexota bacterium]